MTSPGSVGSPYRRKRLRDARAWIMVAATFVTLAVIYGVWYSYSVFLVALVREFGWSRSLVSGAFSVFVLVHGGLGPVVGWMARRFGPRRLFLIGGVVMGAGLALTAETSQVWHLYLAFGGITADVFSFFLRPTSLRSRASVAPCARIRLVRAISDRTTFSRSA